MAGSWTIFLFVNFFFFFFWTFFVVFVLEHFVLFWIFVVVFVLEHFLLRDNLNKERLSTFIDMRNDWIESTIKPKETNHEIQAIWKKKQSYWRFSTENEEKHNSRLWTAERVMLGMALTTWMAQGLSSSNIIYWNMQERKSSYWLICIWELKPMAWKDKKCQYCHILAQLITIIIIIIIIIFIITTI